MWLFSTSVYKSLINRWSLLKILQYTSVQCGCCDYQHAIQWVIITSMQYCKCASGWPERCVVNKTALINSCMYLNQGMAVDRILELVTRRTIFPEIRLQLYFLKENCDEHPDLSRRKLACSIFNTLEDLWSYLRVSTTKTRFGEETDRLLAKLGQPERRKQFSPFKLCISCPLRSSTDNHPAYGFYWAVRIFDPHQLPSLGHDIDECECEIKALESPSPELMEEWLIYTQFGQDSLPTLLEFSSFWASMAGRFPFFRILLQMPFGCLWLPLMWSEVSYNINIYWTRGGRAWLRKTLVASWCSTTMET